MNRANIATLRIAALTLLILSLAITGLSVQSAMQASASGATDARALGIAALGVLAALGSAWLLAIARRFAVAPEAKPAPAIQAAAPPRPREEAEPGAEALMLLALLQEKGRFVDFVMEDISAYTNDQVGAAARVVHQGCRAVITDSFAPLPVAPMENARITLEPGYDAEEFRLVGHADGAPPFTVKVTHKGWRAQHVKLPRRLKAEKILEKPIIVPAEVVA